MPARSPEVAFWETGSLDEHVSLIRRQVRKSVQDPELRALALKIVAGKADEYIEDPRTRKRVPVAIAWGEAFRLPHVDPCGHKDAVCESQALWNFAVENVRYVLDPDGYDLFATAKYTLLAGGGDCFPEGTRLLTDDYRLTPIEHLRAGQRIWGRDRWSEVCAVGTRGDRAITSIQLNNGSWLRLTDEHKVYVAECPTHPRARKSGPCSCPQHERETLRVTVAELEPGMVLVQPERIAFAAERRTEGLAFVEGAYLADGWTDGKVPGRPSRVAFSGRDGHPKQAVKAELEAWAARHGYATRMHERYLAINDAELASSLHRFGSGAPHKALPDVAYHADDARELLRGLLLHSSRNTSGGGYTFGSTSETLALQVRVLARMLGLRSGWATVVNHGGLGKHPVHRVTLPNPDAPPATQKLLRVKSVVRVEADVQRVWDLRTDDHYVYLPEQDVTVSNCDDFVILLAALHKLVGFSSTLARIVSTNGKWWEHVYLLVGFPKQGGVTQHLALDPTVRGATPGWEYKHITHYADYEL